MEVGDSVGGSGFEASCDLRRKPVFRPHVEQAAFASALVLAMIALLIGYESLARLMAPVSIAFGEAIPLAALGLGVNLFTAWLLRDEHDAEHDDVSACAQDADNNLRAAYIHVAADAAVSMLALCGLAAASWLGWVWLDPLMGIVGMLVIAKWSWNLVLASGAVRACRCRRRSARRAHGAGHRRRQGRRR